MECPLTHDLQVRLESTGFPSPGTWGAILLAAMIGLWTTWYLCRREYPSRQRCP